MPRAERVGIVDPIDGALARLRRCVASFEDWYVLAKAITTGLELAKVAKPTGVTGHFKAASDALQQLHARAQDRATGDPLYRAHLDELECLETAVEIFCLLLRDVTRPVYDAAVAIAWHRTHLRPTLAQPVVQPTPQVQEALAL